MGEDFPVPMSIGTDLEMTLIDGEEEIPFTLRRVFTWKRDTWKLRDIMAPDQLREWRFHNVSLFASRARDVTEALLDAAKRGITLYEKPDPIVGRQDDALSPVGYATRDIDLYVEDFFRPVFAPLSISEKVSDPMQRMTVCFARMQGNTMIELVEPFSKNSPIDSVISGNRGGVYHLCYEVDDLDREVARCRKTRCMD